MQGEANIVEVLNLDQVGSLVTADDHGRPVCAPKELQQLDDPTGIRSIAV
jgi:hypothetical protein